MTRKGKSKPSPLNGVDLQQVEHVYRDDVPERAYRLSLLGLDNKDLAVSFGVSPRTIERWKDKHPEFERAIEKGREEADGHVVYSLYKKATGYTVDDVHVAVTNGQVIETPIKKYYPPDTTAAIFWLKNRQKSKWADVWKMEFEGTIKYDDEQNTLEDLSEEELQVLKKYALIQGTNSNEQHGDEAAQ